MNALTFKFRLIWDFEKIIIGDPFEEHLNSTTLVNTSNYFQTDILNEVQSKIDELGLTFAPEEPPEEPLEDPNPIPEEPE